MSDFLTYCLTSDFLTNIITHKPITPHMNQWVRPEASREVGKLEPDLDTPVFPIGVVKRLVGLTERQIRYYDKMGLVVPYRTKGGTRMYSGKDILILKQVKGMMEQGFRVKEVKERFEERKARESRVSLREGSRAASVRGAAPLEGDDERPVILHSLYPVSDQAALMKALDKIRND